MSDAMDIPLELDEEGAIICALVRSILNMPISCKINEIRKEGGLIIGEMTIDNMYEQPAIAGFIYNAPRAIFLDAHFMVSYINQCTLYGVHALSQVTHAAQVPRKRPANSPRLFRDDIM
jgi:hypothetical protein